MREVMLLASLGVSHLPEEYPCPKCGHESVTSILDENGLAETSCGSCGHRIYPTIKTKQLAGSL